VLGEISGRVVSLSAAERRESSVHRPEPVRTEAPFAVIVAERRLDARARALDLTHRLMRSIVGKSKQASTYEERHDARRRAAGRRGQ